MDITIDNSALSLLYCKRRFQLTVLRGLSSEDNEILRFGSSFHKAVEYLDHGATQLEALQRVDQEIPDIDIAKLTLTIMHFKQSQRYGEPILINDRKAVELKFKWLYRSIILPTGQSANIYLAGTIDRIEIDPSTDTLIIRDYKTAGDATEYLAKKKLDDYSMSFQLPFYVFALFNGGFLPEQYLTYLKERRYRVEFTFAFYNLPTPTFKSLVKQAYPDDFIMNEVPLIINNRAVEAANIAMLGPEKSAPHDGMNVYKGCTFCPYKIACLCMGTEREEEFLARFPLRAYDPLSFR